MDREGVVLLILLMVNKTCNKNILTEYTKKLGRFLPIISGFLDQSYHNVQECFNKILC